MPWLWIAAGGAAGSVLRVAALWQLGYLHLGRLPLALLLLNASGCLMAGVLHALLIERSAQEPIWAQALLGGFLGAFTTFSTFSLESLSLMRPGYYSVAAVYMASNLALCLIAAAAGVAIARNLL